METGYGRISLPVYPNQHTQRQRHLKANVVYAKKKLQNINCILQPTSTSGGLFLGDIISIMKPQILINHQIKAVISCLSDQNHKICQQGITVKTIKAKDTLDYPINEHFDETYQFIEEMLEQKKNLLVHCHAGISRSATIVCAYLMKKKKLRMSQALQQIKNKRQRVKPNENFMNILLKFQQKLFQMKEPKPIFNRIRTAIKGQNEGKPLRKILVQFDNNRVNQSSETIHKYSSSTKISRAFTSPQPHVHPLKISFQSPGIKASTFNPRDSYENFQSLKNQQINQIREKRIEGVYRINWGTMTTTR